MPEPDGHVELTEKHLDATSGIWNLGRARSVRRGAGGTRQRARALALKEVDLASIHVEGTRSQTEEAGPEFETHPGVPTGQRIRYDVAHRGLPRIGVEEVIPVPIAAL